MKQLYRLVKLGKLSIG